MTTQHKPDSIWLLANLIGVYRVKLKQLGVSPDFEKYLVPKSGYHLYCSRGK